MGECASKKRRVKKTAPTKGIKAKKTLELSDDEDGMNELQLPGGLIQKSTSWSPLEMRWTTNSKPMPRSKVSERALVRKKIVRFAHGNLPFQDFLPLLVFSFGRLFNGKSHDNNALLCLSKFRHFKFSLPSGWRHAGSKSWRDPNSKVRFALTGITM